MEFSKEMIKPMSFGMSEQLLMLSSILAGLIGSKKEIVIFTLILISFSNSLPDTISYYQNSYQENNDVSKSLVIAGYVFITELIVASFIIAPIILIPNTTIAIMVSYTFAIVLCYVNLRYLMHYDMKQSLSQLVIYASLASTIFAISKGAKKYFKINI